MYETTKKVGGMERYYKRPYPIDQAIPTLSELMANHDHEFIEAFAANSEGLTWITRQKLSIDNHSSYIYAMAIYAETHYNPSNRGRSWQFEHNLRKLQNKIYNKGIVLTAPEKIAMNYMLYEMQDQSRSGRTLFLKSIIKDLERYVVPISATCG